MSKVLFYVARHGSTDDTQKKNIFRGNRNSKLDEKGFDDADELNDFFSDKDWKHIFISPMTRAGQTARVIAGPERKNEVSTPLPDLGPWNIGYLTGKDKKQFEPDMRVFIDHPDMRPQGGETLAEFRARTVPLFLEAIEMGLHGEPPILIGHSSVMHVLTDMLCDNDNGKDFAVKPGGVLEIYLKGGKICAKPVFKEGNDDSSFSGKQASS